MILLKLLSSIAMQITTAPRGSLTGEVSTLLCRKGNVEDIPLDLERKVANFLRATNNQQEQKTQKLTCKRSGLEKNVLAML